jgi:TolB protein
VVVVVVFAAVLAAPASPHRRNAGIVWAEANAIYGANADGSGRHKITAYYGRYLPDNFSSPVWSPSGRVLAYSTCGSDTCFIQLFGPSGRKRTLSLDKLQAETSPTWSPDGQELAFTSSRGSPIAGEGISAVSVVSRRMRRITPPKVLRMDEDPSWSPDGTTIAFVRFVSKRVIYPFLTGAPVIYLVGADGRRLRWLTRGESPSWSPDGRRLVFAWGDGIYTIEPSGHGRTRIARVRGTKGDLLQPRWSPDGRKILYTTTPYGRHPGIWVMDADGSDRKRVVTIRGFYRDNALFGANWKP